MHLFQEKNKRKKKSTRCLSTSLRKSHNFFLDGRTGRRYNYSYTEMSKSFRVSSAVSYQSNQYVLLPAISTWINYFGQYELKTDICYLSIIIGPNSAKTEGCVLSRFNGIYENTIDHPPIYEPKSKRVMNLEKNTRLSTNIKWERVTGMSAKFNAGTFTATSCTRFCSTYQNFNLH